MGVDYLGNSTGKIGINTETLQPVVDDMHKDASEVNKTVDASLDAEYISDTIARYTKAFTDLAHLIDLHTQVLEKDALRLDDIIITLTQTDVTATKSAESR